MSDFENENVDSEDESLATSQPSNDYEVAFTYHFDDNLERAYDKAYHWVRSGVRPDTIFLEDRAMGVINFHKEMKDPLLIQAGVERYVDFRCSLTLSDTDVDAVFSSVNYYEPGAEPTYINAYDPELSSIKEVLNMVSNNLFAYLRKPLVSRD
jgi:hypothetical protein